ncbi:homocitrate synthase [Herbivorax sp. ANBcel31]|uniref:homocitrate synthase n=1 Tax=Herbivorax sp. ANBcel31 TaxID=3069754 RepID=UPI0027B23DEA|nr:homocitrate synthase [Herbivorax sp. ANBcel31]MDQ2087099.1 homocitrate synthase [Herbivorax sp. ANBcel31]
MLIKIVDTTLRDGEQRAGVVLRKNDKIQIAKMLDYMGVYQIEAGIPAMGGEEKNSIYEIMGLGLKSRISAWNRMNINDIKESIDINPHIMHISVPSSDIQIQHKFGKDREWVLENMMTCVNYAREKGFEVTLGLEDASRADFNFILSIITYAYKLGVERVRYADTVGILYRNKIYQDIQIIKKHFRNIKLEIHTHNDLGMAVSNSIGAVRGGVEFVDCTIGGIGERAGNCDFLKFVISAKGLLGSCKKYNVKEINRIQKSILKIIDRQYEGSSVC